VNRTGVLHALLVAAVLVFAGCAGTVGPSATDAAAAGANATDVNAVTADGAATVTADPDRAGITVAVESTADDASAARSRVAYETADAGGSTSFEPGPVTVSASVTVTYELE